jgi:hypothetical protein
MRSIARMQSRTDHGKEDAMTAVLTVLAVILLVGLLFWLL